LAVIHTDRGDGMRALVRNRVLRGSSAFVLAIPAAMSAQQKSCNINDSSPFQINGAKQYVTMAASSRKADEIPKHLSNSIRVLTENPDRINNEVGRQDLLARTYVQWLKREGATYVMKRKDLGFTTNLDASQNLLLALDSAVVTLDRLVPECKERVHPYRDQFSSEIYNKAVSAMNADKNDSSVYYSQLALQIASTDPRPWNLLSAVYQKQNKLDSAMLAMEKVINLSGTDSLYKKVKQQSRYNLAVIKLTNAEAGSGAAKDEQIKQARALLEAYLKDAPGEASATQALGRAMRLSGDTAAVASVFAEMLKAPDKFTADQLFEAASNAAASAHDKDAVTLFESGLKKNPNHRTALLNLSNVLFQMKDVEKMGPVVHKLTEIDPNFDRGWRLVAGFWQLRARGETDAAKKKSYNDSTLFYLDRQTKTNPRVDVTLAAKAGNAFQMQGTVSNDGQVAGTWTINFELLDPSGAVVGTRDVPVGPIDAGSSTTFSVKVDSPKAVAYRYAPIK
jgi:Flp pilus assembly protein TadD